MTAGLTALGAYLRARDDAEAGVAPHMRSQLYAGTTDEIVILLHGLTASPPAWTTIAADLNAAGATVVTLRLPLHGYADRMTLALSRLTAGLLISDLRAVVEAAQRTHKRIVIGGHSLGGTLAIRAAETLAAVERVVAVAPFLGIAGFPHELHRASIPLIRRLPNRYLWWDPVDRGRQQPDYGYPRYPLHALAVGIGIAEAAFADAGRKPYAHAIDLVVNARESSVNNRAVLRLAARWRGAGAAVSVHRLDGLPPSHDIIDPLRPHSARVRATLVRLLLGERADDDVVMHVV